MKMREETLEVSYVVKSPIYLSCCNLFSFMSFFVLVSFRSQLHCPIACSNRNASCDKLTGKMYWECGIDGSFVTPEPDRTNCTEDWIYSVEENVRLKY